MISIIVAIDENNGIGKDNDLMWHLSDDLKRFKAITTGHTVVMGRNTWLSLPFKPLKNRRNIIISTTMESGEGYEVVRTPKEAVATCGKEEKCYIIGGATVYRQMIPYTDELIITHVYKRFDADTFFPEIKTSEWLVAEESEIMHDASEDVDYKYVTYRRR
jgi:dihydrofolate reductase